MADRALVLRIIMAMNDTRDATDKLMAFELWSRLQSDTRAVELAAWQVLVMFDGRGRLGRFPRKYT